MCIIRAYKVNQITLHSLKAHPNIGLDVFHDVANVEFPVGIGQGCGYKKATHGDNSTLNEVSDFILLLARFDNLNPLAEHG